MLIHRQQPHAKIVNIVAGGIGGALVEGSSNNRGSGDHCVEEFEHVRNSYLPYHFYWNFLMSKQLILYNPKNNFFIILVNWTPFLQDSSALVFMDTILT